MEPLLVYFGKMILCSAVMFAYYLIFLKDRTFHHYNRFYLLFLVLVSLFLPMVKVSYFTIETNQDLYLLLSRFNQNQFQNLNNDITIYSVFYTVAGLVSVALLSRLILGLLKINAIKNQFPSETIEGIKFYQTNLSNAPFSFFRNLFWKQSIEVDSPVGQQILKHEMVHIEQKHSWDKLLMQTAKSVFWFNPVFYFINKEINLIHEYLADNKAVKKSDTKAFAQMLLESHFSGSVIPVTSPFLSSNLKKRLKMLTKNQTKYSYARKLCALPILFLMVFAYMVNAKNKEITETNKAIAIAVSEIKNDTIKPQNLGLDSLSAEGASKASAFSQALQEDHLKMSSISQKMADKGKVMSALKKAKKEDSQAYKSLENEMEKLADQMEDIVNSDAYKKNIQGLEGQSEALAKMYDSPAFKKKIAAVEKKAKETEAYYNSPAFRKKIADVEQKAKETEAYYNSPAFKKRIADVEKKAQETEAYYNSPEFKKGIEMAEKLALETSENIGKIFSEAEFHKMVTDQFGKNAFSDGTVRYLKDDYNFPKSDSFNFNFNDGAFDSAKSKLSTKELKKLEKKRNQLFEKQKKLQLQQKQLNKDFQNLKTLKISYNTNLVKPNVVILDNGKLASNNYTTDLYINGIKVDSSELQKLDPNKISTMNVLTDNNFNTVKIYTK